MNIQELGKDANYKIKLFFNACYESKRIGSELLIQDHRGTDFDVCQTTHLPPRL